MPIIPDQSSSFRTIELDQPILVDGVVFEHLPDQSGQEFGEGTTRYNQTLNVLQIYDGTNWTNAGGTTVNGLAGWQAPITYAQGDFVTWNGRFYRSTINGNLGLQPDLNNTQWSIFPTQTQFFSDSFSPTDGQTLFGLSNNATNPQSSTVTVNQATLVYGIDYVIAGSTLQYTNTSYPLNTIDILYVRYF